MKIQPLTTARDQAAADSFAEMLEYGGDGSPEARIALALRPGRPLNEARRARMRDMMLAAFDSNCPTDGRAVAPIEAADVSTAEVLTEHGSVRMADVETIGTERAQEAAAAALRHIQTVKGGSWVKD